MDCGCANEDRYQVEPLEKGQLIRVDINDEIEIELAQKFYKALLNSKHGKQYFNNSR